MSGWIDAGPLVRGFAVRSPTLPPATHTNVWVLGDRALTVVDPASPWPEEQARLADALTTLARPVERIVLTHHHHDHIGGARALAGRLGVPIHAHDATAARLGFSVEPLADRIDCGGVWFDVFHTPGHAPGHVVLRSPDAHLVAGDMVAGVGTIAIDPDDGGHLGDYLASLERMRGLGARALLPAHGPILADADAALAHYLAHRAARTEQIARALARGDAAPIDLVGAVYPDLDRRLWPLAAVQVRAHLVWLVEQGRARTDGSRWSALSG